MRNLSLLLMLFAAGIAWAPSAMAKNKAPAPKTVSSEQIEITADQSLELYKEKRLYVARGNAKAVQDTTTVEADILTAHERDKAEKTEGTGGNIDRLTAEGNVRITDPRQQIYGDFAEYDLDTKKARVTGNNLKYVSGKNTVTAKESLEYDQAEGLAIARGKAIAVQDNRHIEGDVLTAKFSSNTAGQQELIRMTAEGNVVVITANDLSRGDKAVYDAKGNTAVLTGHVRITRGEIQLAGDKAEVDFTKNESRLLNQGHGRVRALLSPQKNNNKTSIEAPIKAKETKSGENSGTIEKVELR